MSTLRAPGYYINISNEVKQLPEPDDEDKILNMIDRKLRDIAKRGMPIEGEILLDFEFNNAEVFMGKPDIDVIKSRLDAKGWICHDVILCEQIMAFAPAGVNKDAPFNLHQVILSPKSK